MTRALFLPAWWARYGPRLFALVCVGAALAYGFASETPVGQVRGRVLLAGTGKPLPGVVVRFGPVEGSGEQRGGRAVTGADGRFVVRRIAAGAYFASAYTHAHEITSTRLDVDEGETTDLPLVLTRTQPDLQVAQHQRVFATGETPFLPVRGYVDGKKPANRDSVRIRVFRTRLSDLLQNEKTADALEQLGRRDAKPSGLSARLLRPPFAAPRLVAQRDIRITGADREGFYHQRVALFGTQKLPGPGLFLVDVRHNKTAVSAWILATDTALVVKRSKRQLVAFAVDMARGTPVAGSQIRVYRGGRVIAQARTDERGLAELDVAAASGNTRLTTVALRGDDEAVLGRSDYQYEDQNRFAIHAYTDRPIYRPGQRVFYKGIARQKNETGGRYRVPSGQAVTLELRDPGGERIAREQLATNAYGSFHGFADLSPEAPTGTYSLIVQIGGETHTHDVVVAAYRKPEFAVTVTPGRKRYAHGEPIEMTVKGAFYFGAPVAGVRVRYTVYGEVDWSAEYPEEYGYDASEDGGNEPYEGEGFYGEAVAEGEATLDENGTAVVRFSPDKNKNETGDEPDAPQERVYTLHASVTDQAGRLVEGQGVARVTAGDFRLSVQPEGYVAEPNKPITVLLSARDHDGKPVPNTTLELEPAFERWNQKEKKREHEPVGVQKVVTDADGQAVATVVPPHAGELELRARAVDANGRTIRARSSVWVASDGGGDLQTEYTDLSLLTDKRRYAPGDTARVLLNTAHRGQTVLLTVEGDRIRRTLVVPVTQRSTIVRVPVLAEYGPNVVLAACYVQSKRFATSEVPLRVTMPQADVKVSVRGDKTKYRPGEPITYQIETRDPQGRPVACEFSLGVVDESIYALREDDPRALRNAFYPRRYNTVSTGYSFAIEYLGDADKTEPNIEARKRFPDTAYWEPALHTDAQGRATVRFELPDNLTTWRATVMAQTANTALGREISKVVVAKEFFVRLEKPRVLTEHDTSRLLALVHNETGTTQTALVRLQADGLAVENEATQTVNLAPGQVGQVTWNVSADRMGEAKLRVTAWTPRVSGGPQYTDGVETTLPVRPHGREQVGALAGALGEAATQTETLHLEPAAIMGASRLTIRVTPSVTSSLVGALEYLIGYPYGCTEQTMSRFLPDLLVQGLANTQPVLNADKQAQIPLMVRDGLARLYRLQHQSGAWGWWEHEGDDPFMTAYVLYGLATAQTLGYEVSPTVLRRGREAAVQMLARTEPNRQPFLLYALVLAGDRETPQRVRATLRRDKLSSDALAYLVLLGEKLGKTDTDALQWLRSKAVERDATLSWRSSPTRPDSSNRMTTALALRALLAVDPQDRQTTPVLRWLMMSRTGAHWSNTRDTSWVLAALCDYLAARPETSDSDEQIGVRVNGQLRQTLRLTPDARRERELVVRVPGRDLKPGANDVTLERARGTSTIFYSVELRQTIAAENLPAVGAANLSIEREYRRVVPLRSTGEPWRLQTEAANNTLEQGDSVRVRLTITAPRDLAYVLIEDPFPSGCEVTERGSGDEVADWDYWYSGVDVRDDKIAFFARTLSQGRHVIEYNLRAQTPGTYHTLPALLQAMYAPEIRAETAEAQVTVR